MIIDEVFKGSYQRYIAADFCRGDFFVNKRIPIIIEGINADNVSALKLRLLDLYGDAEAALMRENRKTTRVALSKIEGCDFDCVVIEGGAPLIEQKRFDFSDLVQIMKRLRAPDGCEWDKAQTHESIRINLIEEAYELVDAIDCANKDMLLEECGDVLMQAVFHTEIAEQEGEFNFSDMLSALCRKLIDRHTHIFGQNHAQNADEALVFWNEAKKKEKKYKSSADAMSRIPKNLPALLYAEKLQKLAKKSGFDWKDVNGAADKVYEELRELLNADETHRTEEAGDLLFAVVNVLRFYKIEPEMALHEANAKFFRRFEAVERIAEESGRRMTELSLGQLDEIWENVKESERK